MADTGLNSTPVRPARSWRRKLIWILGSFVVLLVAAYFILTSSAFIKGVVLPRVGHALNAELTVTELQLSPLSQVSLKGLKLTPKGQPQLLTANLVRVRYHGFALLRGNLEVDEITIESPVINLKQLADGSSNLDPLLEQPTASKRPATTDATKPLVLNLKQITIKNATLRREVQTKDGGTETMALSGLNLTATDIKNGGTGRLEISSQLQMENTAATGPDALAATLAGKFDFNLAPILLPDHLTGKATFAVQNAGGNFAEAAGLAATLDCEVTPTEVKQIALQFLQGDTRLARLHVAGPFDAAKLEGKLKVQLSSVDRAVLNLAGAMAGLDFGPTVINANSEIQIEKGGEKIAATGQIQLNPFQITYAQQTTPRLDLRCDYDAAWNRATLSALLKTLDITGTQNRHELLTVALTQPISLAVGSSATALSDAALNLRVSNLNLADWQAFAADLSPGGVVNATAQVTAQKGAQALSFNLDTSINQLAAKVDDLKLNGLDVKLTTQGSVTDLSRFKVDKLQLDLTQHAQPVLSASVNGDFHSDTQAANLQVTAQVAVSGLLTVLPQQGAEFSSGTLELRSHLLKTQTSQTTTGQLTLSNLRGRYADYHFNSFGSSADWDVTLQNQDVVIRQLKGNLRDGDNPGGNFDLSGQLNLTTQAGQLSLKLAGLNQNGLRPFLESALGDKKLRSVSLDSTASVNASANGDMSLKGDFQVSNLVVQDPQGSLPTSPLAVKAQLDVGVAKAVAQIRQAQLTLTPTDRAKNQLNLTGNVDYSQGNAITGQLKLTAETLDVTPYYDLFANAPTKATTVTNVATPATPGKNVEPDPAQLPFQNFSFEAAIQRLYLREIDVENLQMTAKLDNHQITLKPMTLTLNRAPVNATVALDLGTRGYKYDVTFQAQDVPVAPLANTFSPTYRDQADGQLTAQADLKGTGVTGVSLREHLNGSAHFSFTNANIQITGPKLRAIITPIALGLGAPELLDSPLNYVNADLRAANGQIEIPDFIAHSATFIATTRGAIPIADVLDDSPLNQNLDISLAGRVAKNLRISNQTTNDAYVQLPTFARLTGTLGSPDVKTDKTVIFAFTAGTIGNVIGGKAGGVLGEVGAILGGKPVASDSANANTNAPATNASPADPVGDLLNLFKKPKK